MKTYKCDLPLRPIKLGELYILGRYHGQTIKEPVESVKDAAFAFAQRYARRVYGKRGICHHVRQDSHREDGSQFNYEAFIGVPCEGGGTSGKNIWLSVSIFE